MRQLLGSYVLWGVIASATFFLLWPALWIDPIGIFVRMYSEMTEYIGGHSNPNYFMGQILHDPGRSSTRSPITSARRRRAHRHRRHDRRGLEAPPAAGDVDRAGRTSGLLVFALLFTLFMTAPAIRPPI